MPILPAADLTTTHLDGTDDRADLARVEILADIQKLNATLTALKAIAGARVYKSGDQSITTGTYTRLSFDSETYDSASIHDNATNNERLTVPTGAVYGRFTAQVDFASDATGYRSVVIENGNTSPNITAAAEAIANAVNGSATIINLSTGWIPVTPGDYYRLGVLHNNGSSVTVVGGNAVSKLTFFAVEFLG
jgi:hypothetical protein